MSPSKPLLRVDVTSTSRRRAQELAASQHGLISRRQLLALGLSGRTLAAWIARGVLVQKAPRVYLLGRHAATVEQTLFMAVPLPRLNVRVHGVLVDAYWPEQRLVVELDGLKNHRSQAQLRRDKRNDLTLREHGLMVVRYDWPLLHANPRRVHADLMSHLGRLL